MSAAISTASPADAAPERARVVMDYSAPSDRRDCPDRDAVARSIAIRLGYDPFAADVDDHLEIAIAPRGRTLEAVVRLERPTAPPVERTRASSSGDCAELAEVAAFTAATLLDPRAVFAGRKEGTTIPGESLDVGRPLVPPASVPDEPRPPPPLAPPSEDPSWRVRVGARTTGCLGCAPAPNLGFGLIVGAQRARWGVDFGGRWDLPSSVVANDGTGVASSLLLFEAFPHVRVGPARLGPLGAIGSLSGRSIGVEGRSRENSLWAGVGARAGLELKLLGPLFVHASVDGTFVLSRVHLVVRESERWSSGLVATAVSFGVVAAF
ncbi:MAG TPA: hypothetical protein VM925_12775 [Labilithrix sp.]|nr:hypothetical protein [Labilithrix sp.]